MLDVVQYGEKIIGLLPDGSYSYNDGTSFPTPIVTGIALLFISKYKKIRGKCPDVAFLKEYLMSSVIDLGAIGEDDFYGKGFCTLDHQRWVTTEMWIDRPYMVVNGATIQLDQPPTILNGRTVLPVRALSETLTQTVTWNEIERKVTLEGIRL